MGFTRSVTEVARNFAEYVNRVAYRGERFVLIRGRRPVAELRPLPAGRTLEELPDLFASLPRLAKDDIDSFERDIEEARSQNTGLPRDPWES
jgi:antitoxin (DNA-binding transcriptional repressor) of toxin-antitoxin stability system